MSRMNEELLLISLVQKYPELYKLEESRYHNGRRRMNIWIEIAEVMLETPVECKEKWKRLRENFRKAHMLRRSKTGKNFQPIRYSKELNFLMPYIKIEPDSSALPLNSYDEQSNQSNASSLPSPPGSPAESVVTTESAKKSTKKIKTEEASMGAESSFQSNAEREFSRDFQEEDPIVAFFKNLGQTVMQFPPDLRVRVKRAVFNVVSEAEEELIQRNDSVRPGGHSSSSKRC